MLRLPKKNTFQHHAAQIRQAALNVSQAALAVAEDFTNPTIVEHFLTSLHLLTQKRHTARKWLLQRTVSPRLAILRYDVAQVAKDMQAACQVPEGQQPMEKRDVWVNYCRRCGQCPQALESCPDGARFVESLLLSLDNVPLFCSPVEPMAKGEQSAQKVKQAIETLKRAGKLPSGEIILTRNRRKSKRPTRKPSQTEVVPRKESTKPNS